MAFSIGSNIKNLRIENQMTEYDLSVLLSCSEQLIKSWEDGSSYPDILLLPKIASIFNVSLDYLTTGEILTHKNYDQILDKVSKKDDPNLLDDDIIKGIDKKNLALIDYIIKNESTNLFSYLVNNNKLKYAISNRNIKNIEDDIIYIALISGAIKRLPSIGLTDVSTVKKWPIKALNAISMDNRVIDEDIDYILTIHKRDITYDEYLYMPNDSRHVKGLWQETYPLILEYVIKNNNIKLAHKIYNAMLDANSYALNVLKNNNTNYKLFSTPLDRYQAQNINNIPIVCVKKELLDLMLENKQYSILKLFNNLNKSLKEPFIDSKLIDEAELSNDKNATDMDILKIKFVKMGLLNIKEMLNSFTNPSEYDKHVLFNMINTYPISYLELVNDYIINNEYKKLFEFSVDNELDDLTILIMNNKYDEIIPYIISLFGYTDVTNDGHIKELKTNIKKITFDLEKYKEENNAFMINRCYEKIAKLIDEEKNNWTYNLLNKNRNLNHNIYREMLDAQNEVMSFSNLMNMNKDNIKKISDSYKIKLYNEFLKKVG